MSPILSLSYWFSLRTLPFLGWMFWFVMVVLGLLTVGAVVLDVMSRRVNDKFVRRFWRRGVVVAWTGIVIGWLLWFMTWQRVPVLGMRVWWVVWLIGHGVWAWTVWNSAQRLIPATYAARQAKEAYEKWLPKPKKS